MSPLSLPSTFFSYGASKYIPYLRDLSTNSRGASVSYRNPVYHEVIFAILMLTTAARIHHLLRQSTTLPKEVKSSIGTTFATGSGLFILGFVIWNLDNIFCSALTRQKAVVGYPIAFLLEGACLFRARTAGA
jgi:hypothetical protein